MFRALPALAATSLSLVGLYLVLTNFIGSTQILRAFGEVGMGILKTLQGR